MRLGKTLVLQIAALALVASGLVTPAYSPSLISSIITDIGEVLEMSPAVPRTVPRTVSPAATGTLPPGTSQVAGDAAGAHTSLATVGGHNLLQDTLGKYIVVYVDTMGQLSIVYSNGDPLQTGWSIPVKSPLPAVAYSRPAAVLPSLDTLKIVAMGGNGVGHIVDVTASLRRNALGNIVEVLFESPVTLDTGSQHPAATNLHDGSVIAVWNSRQVGVFSKVNTLRWSVADGWHSPSDKGSTTPDSPIVDTVSSVAIFPNVIQRKDDLTVYVVGNRGAATGSPTNLVFNSATYTGRGWNWGVQDLAYETNVSRGAADSPDLVWDPTRSAVVMLYDITGMNQYGVILLFSSGIKIHIDVPPQIGIGQDEKRHAGTGPLNMTNNEWGSLQVDTKTGDYYLFTIDTPASTVDGSEMGMLGFIKYSGGVWQTSPNMIDSDMDNMGTAPKRVSGPGLIPLGLVSPTNGTLEFLYCQGATSPTTLTFVRLSTS